MRRLYGVLATMALVGGAGIAGPVPASASDGATTAAPPADTVTVEIPMQVVPKQSSNGGVTPNVVIPGNCGTAFLYASRTGTGQAHVDFGFEYLTTPAVYVSGHVGMINLDNQGTAYQSWGGLTWGTRSWEKQTNLTASPRHSTSRACSPTLPAATDSARPRTCSPPCWTSSSRPTRTTPSWPPSTR